MKAIILAKKQFRSAILSKGFELAFIPLVACFLLTASCSEKTSVGGTNDSAAADLYQRIFSNRPSEPNTSLLVLKLKLPPVLSSAERKDGKIIIDPELYKAVGLEQDAAVAKLLAISSELKIIYRYKMTLNALFVSAPTSMLKSIESEGLATGISSAHKIARPKLAEVPKTNEIEVQGPNPLDLIGATQTHAMQIKLPSGESVAIDGRGVKVGIIDTGIDFTHAMFGGLGTEEAYKAVDPKAANVAGFPNLRVVGGHDFAGTEFNTSAVNEDQHIPHGDNNPIDEAGHGSHVAGTVAGMGDGKLTYSGVAPGASLYALKVFGEDGSTSDAVVVSAMEYSVDPNGDGNIDDRLDVLNLSLGSDFGYARGYYSEAIANLDRAGISVITAAGNAGNFDFIAGSPSVNDEAMSVAASVDNSFANTRFGATVFESTKLGRLVAERVEGPASKPIIPAEGVKGKLVYIGIVDADLSAELAAKLKGNVALILRGKVPFVEKLKRAEASGAIAAVVMNSVDGAPFAMGGDGTVGISAIMISKANGEKIKAALDSEDVIADFSTAEVIDKPELIDTISDFSSKGPRSGDSRIKPEVAAPGSNILSAAMGKGSKGVRFSGTSMATPHMAGAVALVRQARPDLTPVEVKSLLMGRAKILKDKVSRQGAGRVQVDRAVTSPIVVLPEAVSFGNVQVNTRKTLSQVLNIRNLTDKEMSLSVAFESASQVIKFVGLESVSIPASKSADLDLGFMLDVRISKAATSEEDGWIALKNGDEVVYRIPVLAIVRKLSNITSDSLQVLADSEDESAGSVTLMNLKNKGANLGKVLPFNLIATSPRRPNQDASRLGSKLCDLQAAGYRIINKTIEGNKTAVLQIAAKFFDAVTSFDRCELTVLIDSNADGKPDQELAAVSLENLSGFETPGKKTFASVLLDFGKMREIRLKAELDAKTPGKDAPLDYKSALVAGLPLVPEGLSTLLTVEAPMNLLKRSPTGALSIQVASIDMADDEAGEDYLFVQNSWTNLSMDEASQAYVGLPESIELQAGEKKTIRFKKGQSSAPMMLVMPQNKSVSSDVLTDSQMLIVQPSFTTGSLSSP